jgi:hypothetical protein
MLSRTLRKIKKLEALRASSPESNRHNEIVQAALKHLSIQDLELLKTAIEAQAQGCAWTDEQIEVGKRLEAHLAEECTQAGFKSVEEFNRLCPPPPEQTPCGRRLTKSAARNAINDW